MSVAVEVLGYFQLLHVLEYMFIYAISFILTIN